MFLFKAGVTSPFIEGETQQESEDERRNEDEEKEERRKVQKRIGTLMRKCSKIFLQPTEEEREGEIGY